MHHAWTISFAVERISWLPWLLVTPLVLRLGRALSLSRLSSWSVHFAAIVLIGTLCAGWDTTLEALLALARIRHHPQSANSWTKIVTAPKPSNTVKIIR
jgi:hypothetical protein